MEAIKRLLAKRLLAKLTPLQRRLGGFALLVAASVAAYFGLFARAEDRAAVAATLRNPLSVFSARSPGPRVGGALLQTKKRLAATQRAPGGPRPAVVLPRERVLSNVRTRPAAPALALAQPPLDAGLLGTPATAFDLPSVGLPGQPPGFDVPSFGGGDAQPAPGATQPEGPVTPGPAVPEPTVWAMMILGLGAVGLALRGRSALPATRGG